MRLEQSEIFEINGDKYIVLDTINFDGQNYAFVNKLTEEEQWAKLKLVKEIAEEVWGE